MSKATVVTITPPDEYDSQLRERYARMTSPQARFLCALNDYLVARGQLTGPAGFARLDEYEQQVVKCGKKIADLPRQDFIRFLPIEGDESLETKISALLADLATKHHAVWAYLLLYAEPYREMYELLLKLSPFPTGTVCQFQKVDDAYVLMPGIFADALAVAGPSLGGNIVCIIPQLPHKPFRAFSIA